MDKIILDKEGLEEPRKAGMKSLAGIVKTTLGPGGRPIIIERKGQSVDGSPLLPRVTKDGVSVANEASSQDPGIDVVIQSVKSICRKTNQDAGDGTTTAIVLGEAILDEMSEYLKKNPDTNPQLLKEDVERVSKMVISQLKELAEPVEDYERVRAVATISANGDEEIGNVISEALEKVGAEGMITVDEGYSNKVTLDVVEGYQFNRGAEARTYFFNDASKTEYAVEDPYIIIYDGDLASHTKLLAALQKLVDLHGSGKLPPVLVLANQFSAEVIDFCLMQKQQLGSDICLVRGPHATHVRTGYYDDIAAHVGGTRLGQGGYGLESIQDDDFGRCDRVKVDKYKTTIYGGHGHEDDMFERVDMLKKQKEVAESPYDAQILSERIAALTSGVAKIGVGGATEFEIKEKYDRIEDALNAARAAMLEGVVPGGGKALLHISRTLSPGCEPGIFVLRQALQRPFRQILENVGMEHQEINDVIHKVIKHFDRVYDARHREVVEGFDTGIIDPVKVTRSALENAVSIASLLSVSGGAIIYGRK